MTVQAVNVFDEPAALASAAAHAFAEAAVAAIAARGAFHAALTGGSAAKLVYPRVAADPRIDWKHVHLYWGDERAVPPFHPDSNYRLALETLVDQVTIPPANVHRMRADEPDGAEAYERELAAVDGRLDLVHLGMGPDGHVCSLFPGHPLLEERARRVVWVTDSPKPPPRRLTLTLPVLHAARALHFLVAGAEKAGAVAAALPDLGSAAESRLPAALATRGTAPAIWFLDRAASAQLRDPTS